MISGIESARHKLGRATYHIKMLEGELTSYVNSSPYEWEPAWAFDETSQVHTCDLLVAKATEIPDALALIAGDALTNLRAALDHALFDHSVHVWTETHDGPPTLEERRRFGFPTAGNHPGQLTDAVRNRLRPDVFEVVESVQPYNGGDAVRLLWLRDLVNQDKHHQLLVTGNVEFSVSINDHPSIEYVDSQSFPGTVLEEGARFAQVRFTAADGVDPRHVVSMAIGFPISLAVPPDDELEPIDVCLTKIADYVAIILSRLEALPI